ncbi:MAG TPA: hypothetical protein DHW82_03880 [Spirochaetia bacterium]|nr:MAG: hypothetical protein A2Y41_08985 [Spirochaetes bacterium GWB1_36_13]HCL56133.1 hypothetical protein [Spirochaetia bacterium]
MRFIIRTILFNIILFGISFHLFAGPALDTVKTINQLLEKYDEKASNAKEMKEKINQYFLLEDMAKNSIRDHWKKMSEKQKKEYMNLMFQLLEKAVYTDTSENLKKGKVTYLSDKIQGKKAKVFTKIYVKSEDMEIDNDFDLRKNKLWQVADLYIDGASLTEDYRSQFNKIILESGLDGNDNALFPRLRKAVQEDKDEWRKKRDDEKKQEDTTQRETKKRPTLLEGF